MDFKKGNTYELTAKIKNVDIEDINKIVFQFNDIKKIYTSDGFSSDVIYNESGDFIIYLTQEETLQFEQIVKYEVAIKFNDGKVRRSQVYSTSALATIIKESI